MLPVPMVPLPSAGSGPRVLTWGSEDSSTWEPLPTGSRHPLVVSTQGRMWAGVAPRGARSLGDPRAIPGTPSRQLEWISPASAQPRLGPAAGRGVPLLSPPALRRIVWTKHLKLVSPPAGSTCPSPSDAFPPERSLQNKSVLCINKAERCW